MIDFIWVFCGMLIGSCATWLFLKEQLKTSKKAIARLAEVEAELMSCRTRLTEYETLLKAEREFAQEKQKILAQAEKQLTEAFKALSVEALNRNSESFLQLAKTRFENLQVSAEGALQQRQQAIEELMQPVKKALEGFEQKVGDIEKAREGAYSGLTEQVKNLLMSQLRLEKEANNLVKAMRSPNVRGQWGELQLRRTVELAGMVSHVDFFEQATVATEEGRQRPDMLIHLPNQRKVIVDAKAPLSAYLEALEVNELSIQLTKLKEYARHIREHITKLGTKAYWKQVEMAPEFVILFVPGEVFFSAALEQDPTLIEYGAQNQVILATPTTLIALLKAVAYGWRQESIAEEAKEISELGSVLYERMGILVNHLEDIRKGLEKAVTSYNRAANSLEARVLPAARKFSNYKGMATKSVESLGIIEETLVVSSNVMNEGKELGE